MEDYVLAESWHKANVQDRVFYIMKDADTDALSAGEKLEFGDKALSLETGNIFIWGNDEAFHKI